MILFYVVLYLHLVLRIGTAALIAVLIVLNLLYIWCQFIYEVRLRGMSEPPS